MTGNRKIIIDTDPGVGIPGTDADDPIALLLALADPRLDLVGITTTFGNCPPTLGARGAAAVLSAAGRPDIPVAVGIGTPLSGELPASLQEAYRGSRGREGRIVLPSLESAASGVTAVQFIIDTVRANPGEVTIVAIGPQTNLAMALLTEPALKDELASIVLMGGGIGVEPRYGRGNVTSVAECNIYFDPQAADIVFNSGVELTMVGLDVTNPTTGLLLGEASIRAIDTGASPVAELFAAICATYLDAPMFDVAHGCVLYDPLAVAVAADPALGSFQRMAIGIETRGTLTLGQTVPLRDQPANVNVMVDVDGPAVVDSILTQIRSL
jgi:inosine-uridine nucleoside N-ribohydrolase